jgi:hypothetical protein
MQTIQESSHQNFDLGALRNEVTTTAKMSETAGRKECHHECLDSYNNGQFYVCSECKNVWQWNLGYLGNMHKRMDEVDVPGGLK